MRALITGAAGQDGSYMADLLLSKGYMVDGIVRPSGNRTLWRLTEATTNSRFRIIWGDITEPGLFYKLALSEYDEVYHFAAISHVGVSFEDAALILETNTIATGRLLEAFYRFSPKTRIYNAGTSEFYADDAESFSVRSPYGVSKLAAHNLARIYKERGLFVVTGIAYNHESSRRGEHFVTRKIGLSLRQFGEVTLGNLDAKRDWHHAKDCVEGIYLAMQHPTPEEYVFASGESRSVREFAAAACKYFELDPYKAIKVEEHYKRPWDVDFLRGDPSKAEILLGWKRKFSFEDIVEDCCVAVQEHRSLRL